MSRTKRAGHRPLFRWVASLGLLLLAVGVGLSVALDTRDSPDLKQIDLTVLQEKPDGTCTVQWEDPFGSGRHEQPYHCDADRDPVLKAPVYEPGTGLGWDTGFVIAEGRDKGKLYTDDFDVDGGGSGPADGLVAGGVLLAAVGLVGGNIRTALRSGGVDRDVIRRAGLLRDAAAQVAQDHRRALEAVRNVWSPLQQALVDAELDRIPVVRLDDSRSGRLAVDDLRAGGIRTVRDVLAAGEGGLWQLPGVGRAAAGEAVAAARRTAEGVGDTVAVRLDPQDARPETTELVVLLSTLVAAGPQARSAAAEGDALASRLEALLADAAPAAGHRQMLRAGPGQRQRSLAAVLELNLLLDAVERDGAAGRFAQTSVDLLRAPDTDPAALSAWTDFEARPGEYYNRLAEAASRALVPADRGPGEPVG